jgi:hypothetical protein
VADERFINVFLDTQFFDSNQMDFANKTFEVLRLNVAAGHIHVFSTLVTQREVERHVRERAAKAHEKLDTVRKDPLLRHVKQPPFDVFHAGPTAEEIRSVMLAQLKECWESLRTTTLPVNDINLGAVLDDYFSVRPPFGTGKKKAEFPDAFAAQALRTWCRTNGQKMHVVSGDGDWQAVCDAVPEFIFKKELAELLGRFPDARISKAIRGWITSNAVVVQKAISGGFRDYMFFRRPQYEGELLTVDVTRLRIDDTHVIHLDKGVATVEVPCKIAYRFTKQRTAAPDIHYLISLGDPGRIIEGKSKTKAVAEMTMRYDESDPTRCSIENVGVSLRRPFAADYEKSPGSAEP